MTEKYVKLSRDRTEWVSAIFNVKPNPARRWPDRELYRHESASWELSEDNVEHVYYGPCRAAQRDCRR